MVSHGDGWRNPSWESLPNCIYMHTHIFIILYTYFLNLALFSKVQELSYKIENTVYGSFIANARTMWIMGSKI